MRKHSNSLTRTYSRRQRKAFLRLIASHKGVSVSQLNKTLDPKVIFSRRLVTLTFPDGTWRTYREGTLYSTQIKVQLPSPTDYINTVFTCCVDDTGELYYKSMPND